MSCIKAESFPGDPIAVANALVLKQPPFDRISRTNMPNFIKVLHGQLEELNGHTVMLPNLHPSNFVGIFSDYGGDEKDSAYFTYSFLFIALDAALSLDITGTLDRIRARHGLDTPRKEVSFKDLRYGQLDRAVPEWLDAVNGIPGMLFTLVVDKTARSIVTRNSDEALDTLVGEMIAHDIDAWRKRKTAERSLRIGHCVAYWCSLLCREDQQVIWITDRDSVAENASATDSMKRLVPSALAQYRNDLRVTFAFGADHELPPQFRNMKDFTSYADLVAGSVANGFTAAIPRSTDTKSKIVHILRWLAWQHIGLKKVTILIRPEGNGLWGGIPRLDHDEVPDHVEFLPVTYP